MTLTPSKDSSIYSENNSANGTGSLYVGRTGEIAKPSAIRRSLVQFNLSSIPVGATINSVEFQFTVSISANGNPQDLTPDLLSLHRLTKNWGESTNPNVRGSGRTGAAAVAGVDSTWNSAFHNTSAWTTPGGDFASEASGTITLTRPDGPNTEYTFASETGMVADVQNWVNNGSSNFGWMMKYNDEDALQKARGIYSREAPVASLRPTLTINFTAVPEPSTYLLLGVVAFVSSVCRFRRRSVRVATHMFTCKE
ncbi:MAG: DNRLRE domain-containing protein [Planctomycetota bacterium]|nr:DNRLRE domain-containing protein [Planctomycetota bacterium]